jgi:S-adenosylmethionine:diacylglycerol 3-amino-3-carboxypropyl transferase
MPIVFSRAWEDDRLDAELLAVPPGARVLVVAGAGDAALALAASGADVIAVDRNPDQLRLVALKAAAARVLPPDRLHAWFEVGRERGAGAAFRRDVRPLLDGETAAWWDERIGLVESGLHRQGGVGRAFAIVGRVARLLAPGLARAIEAVPDAQAQAAYWRARVRPRLFGPLTHALAARTPLLSPLAPNPHELARMRAGGWSHGLVDRIDAIVATTLVRDHPWWRPAFSGRPADVGNGAAWLDPGRVAALAAGIGRLTLECGDLAMVLAATPVGSLAAISVSNVPDWLTETEEGDLASAALRAAAPGAPIVVRRVVDVGERDAFLAAGLVRDPRSSGLAARDRTALYETVDLMRAPG